VSGLVGRLSGAWDDRRVADGVDDGGDLTQADTHPPPPGQQARHLGVRGNDDRATSPPDLHHVSAAYVKTLASGPLGPKAGLQTARRPVIL
jgi:hypothetical protein